MMMVPVARPLMVIAVAGLPAMISVFRGRAMAVVVIPAMVGMASRISRGRTMTVWIIPAMVSMAFRISRGWAMAMMPVPGMVTAVIIVRGPGMRMGIMVGVIVAAGGQTAHCEKGDGCGELLLVIPCEHVTPLRFFIQCSLLVVSYRREIGRG